METETKPPVEKAPKPKIGKPAARKFTFHKCEVRRPYLATQNIVVYVQFDEEGPWFDLQGRAIEDLHPAQPLEPHPDIASCYRMVRRG